MEELLRKLKRGVENERLFGKITECSRRGDGIKKTGKHTIVYENKYVVVGSLLF